MELIVLTGVVGAFAFITAAKINPELIRKILDETEDSVAALQNALDFLQASQSTRHPPCERKGK